LGARLHRARSRRRLYRGLLAGLLLIAQLAHPEIYREEAVKAAFLNRFTGYIEWPSAALASSSFTIAVLGGGEVADELSKLTAQRSIKNRPARVLKVRSADQATDAHILYVGPEYAGDLRSVVRTLTSRPVLIVTDSASGLDDGSAVNFMLVDRRVRFEVSLSAAHRAGIKISSDLLAVAARVRGSTLRPARKCWPWTTTDPWQDCTQLTARRT
jgi:hypothetical protein